MPRDIEKQRANDRAYKAKQKAKKRLLYDPLRTPLTYDDIMHRSILVDGMAMNVRHMQDEQFRTWFRQFMDSLIQAVQPELSGLLQNVKNESERLPMDKVTRWYYLNELYRMRPVQALSLTLFVDPQQCQEASA